MTDNREDFCEPFIRSDFSLTPDQYVAIEHPKTKIVLHHTVSKDARSAVDWWQGTPERIGTAYIIDIGGEVYQVFEPKYWASHIGVHGRPDLEWHSIGVEIVNEGALLNSGPLYFWNDSLEPTYKFRGDVFSLDLPWRSYKHFAQYHDEQYDCLAELLGSLINKFNIARQVPKDRLQLADSEFNGIVSHAMLRPDKTDVSPAFDWGRLIKELNLQEV